MISEKHRLALFTEKGTGSGEYVVILSELSDDINDYARPGYELYKVVSVTGDLDFLPHDAELNHD